MSNPTFDLPEGDAPILRYFREQGSMPVWTAMKCCGEYPLVLGEIEGEESYLCPVCHMVYGASGQPRSVTAFRE